MKIYFDGQPNVPSDATNGLIRQVEGLKGAWLRIERRARSDDGVRSAMHVETDGDGRFDTTVTYDVSERESSRSANAGKAPRSMPTSRQ